jgi:DNA polymerase III delta subunit
MENKQKRTKLTQAHLRSELTAARQAVSDAANRGEPAETMLWLRTRALHLWQRLETSNRNGNKIAEAVA